jgi:hypothetical protein
MKSRARWVIAFISVSALSACGGGSDDGDAQSGVKGTGGKGAHGGKSQGGTGGTGGSNSGGTSSGGTSSGGTSSGGTSSGGTFSGGTSSGGTSPSGGGGSSGGPCFKAKQLWNEDFETGDYSRWTSHTYDKDWKNGLCHDNGFSTEQAQSPTHSHRSVITCADSESHRGYGGLQFSGDTRVDAYTNQGTGIDAPYGVVNTYSSWLEVPYAFGNGRWFSFWTVNNDCGWNDVVITLGLEDASNKLTPAHILNTGGTVQFVPNAPGFPLGKWVRTSVYINYVTGNMVVWQDGQKLLDATFSRSDADICQWHWGAYASGDNTDIVLYEDDNSIWKLEEAWTNFDVEPWFGHTQSVCP